MPDISIIDLAALAWFLLMWSSYTIFADRLKGGGLSLLTVMKKHRAGWMHQMLRRENRIVDATIMNTLMRSVSLFSSTTLLILAGLLAVLGAVDKAQDLVQGIPFVVEASKAAWELKLLTLILIFIYTFFKFAWSVRQFNYSVILIGSAPPPAEADTPEAHAFARGAANVIALAVSNFNRGMRAYYFGLAALSWFLHPVLFVLVTLWVVGVVYRREFRSQTLGFLEATPCTADNKGAS